ncbi:sigma-70 family RNA polymerase sigma factor [Alkalihalobacillus oceani]|uniref:RNA polymerase sigma factor n=1 Tax=Halalkalibacter oceani TaxID=1653776 RepID=UPI002040F07A|nr:sigma-70 family RNA polymerase sigma factor [Halalkalibacter oceani]MCM3760851.1 sigma-70 family RNA polymerase sigma factor [Halalkalibacter oceani]
MEKLVKKAKKGDGDAFVLLVQQYEEVLYYTAKRLLKNEQDIADVLQDTILSAFEQLHALKKNKYFKTWLYRILLNKCSNVAKQKQTNEWVELQDYFVGKIETFSHVEFNEALNSLPYQQKLIFFLHYEIGYTTKEISELLEIPEGTVKSRLSRGKVSLRNNYYRNELLSK